VGERMKRFIYSIKEIEDKAKLMYSERQLKKDWLAKHIEIISSKTVLKDLKLGSSYWEDAENTEDKYEKFRLYQQSLAHYFMAYFRSNGKDKKSEKELIHAKEEYHSHMFNYFLKIADDFDYYQKDCDFIKEMAKILEEEEKLKSIQDALNTFYYNIEAFSIYKDIMSLKETRMDLVRNKLKEYQDSRTKVAKEISERLEKSFIERIQELDKIVGNSSILLKIDRKRLQNLLKFIAYFNTKSFLKYKNLISKFYNYRALRYYIENEFSYEDYEGLERNYKLFEKIKDIKESNEVVEQCGKFFIKILEDYSKSYLEHNLEKIFAHDKNFDSANLLLPEKFLKKLESTDFDLVKEIEHFKALEKALDENIKSEEIISILDRSYLYGADIMKEKFIENYEKNLQKIEDIHHFKLTFIDKKSENNFIVIFKDKVSIGRHVENDIVINNKYISRKHLVFDLNEDKIINGSSENITFYNNKKEIIDILDIYHDKVREINLGNLFTFLLEETYDKSIMLKPLKEKTNLPYLENSERESFLKTAYILLPNKNSLIIDTEKKGILQEESAQSLTFNFSNVIQVKKKGRNFRTMKPGLNYFDNRFEYILEKI
jgi:hypothetical protein